MTDFKKRKAPRPDENREDRTPSLPVRTPGAGCDDPGLCMWRWPGNSTACGSILPAGGNNQTGAAVRDAHAPRFRHGGKGPYKGGQPDSVAHAEAASGRIQGGAPDRR
jgi:hypothetical protein